MNPPLSETLRKAKETREALAKARELALEPLDQIIGQLICLRNHLRYASMCPKEMQTWWFAGAEIDSVRDKLARVYNGMKNGWK